MPLFGRRERAPAALPVPPFAPDPPPPSTLRPVKDTADPVALLADHGVTLPGTVESLHPAPDRTVWSCPVGAGADPARLWHRVRDVHAGTGLWPVLANERSWSAMAVEAFGEPPPPLQPVDAAAWLTAAAAADELTAVARPHGHDFANLGGVTPPRFAKSVNGHDCASSSGPTAPR